ncbi:MAG: HNH endonuclease signature motif containing protein [Gemmataceae bacterium]
MTAPFHYPASPLVRRHAPRGYRSPIGYRPWLRDEFAFRCVYCLVREVWQPRDLEVEHFTPTVLAPDRATDYANLLYACRACNAAKAAQRIPDPTRALVGGSMTVEPDGTLTATTPAAERIIDGLRLNVAGYRELRRLWIEIVELARRNDPALHARLLRYPDDLPDLSKLRPPGGNERPDGLRDSHFARRRRGELPATY